MLDQQAGTIIELGEANETAVLDDTPHFSTIATSDDHDPDAEVLHQEVDRLEHEIEDLTEFSPGSAFADGAE